MDKLSYALGLSMGGNFIGSGIKKLEINDFADGLRAIFEGAEQKMTFDEAKQIVTEFFTNLEQQGAQENERLGREYLEKNKDVEGVKVTASGLQYQVVKEGDGLQPGPNDVVTVHYTGKLIDGTVFDSSVERGEPATFAVGQVIPGWVEGLQLMREGAAYRLFIPSNLAYGPHGTGPIQPNSTLIFDVQLLKVEKNKHNIQLSSINNPNEEDISNRIDRPAHGRYDKLRQ